MKKLVIFDLDGTLLNTIADLANSTNHALQQCGFPQHAVDKYNFFVGNGINKLFERALPEGAKTEENISRIRQIFLSHYNLHNTDFSIPYPGIPKLLNILQRNGLMLAIASNKYQAATEKLIQHYFSDIHFLAIFGQRNNIPVKPDPTVINEIISIAQIKKEDTLYIGDSGVDMQTAKQADVTSIGVTWGFRPRQELESFHPDHIVEHPESIISLAIGAL